MSVSVNFYGVVVVLVVVLAGLSLVSHFAVRRHVALLWLAMALVAGAIATLTFTMGGSGEPAFVLLAIFDTAAAYAVAQSVRLSAGRGYSARPVMIAVSLLLLLSLILILAGGVSPLLQTVPFQLAGLVVIGDSILALLALERGLARRRMAERAMLVGMCMFAASDLLRLPFYPSLLDSGHAFPSPASSWLNWVLLATSSIYVPLVVIAVIARDIRGAIATYREASERDGLTGLYTRLAFEQAAADAAHRFGALIACDLDHFKSINDNFGHAAGDEVICAFARLCDEFSPIAGRMGGEEFALLLPQASIVEAGQVAEQLRARFAGLRPAALRDHRLSASFGIAAYGGRERFRDTLAKADHALYRAKSQGRNGVVLHGSSVGEQANPILRTA